MSDELRISLNGLGGWNAICDFKEDEQVDINQLLDEAKHDINYYNVILDFDDYLFLQNIINNVPNNKMKNFCIYNIIEQYVLYKIVKASNLEDEFPIEEIGKNLFSGTAETLNKVDQLDWMDISDELKERADANSINGIARIHFPLSDVFDPNLQRGINDLFVWRGKISMVGYTTKKLASYRTTNGQMMGSSHDYISLSSARKKEEDNIEYENKRKKFMI